MRQRDVERLARHLNGLEKLSDGCSDVDDAIQELADKMQAMLLRHYSSWQLDYDLHCMQWYAVQIPNFGKLHKKRR